MGLFGRKLAIDMGTSQTRIIIRHKGVALSEPTVIAKNRDSGEVMAIGYAAQDMIGRTPEAVEAYYPLSHGVIADFQSTIKMLRYFLRQASGRLHLTRPEAMLTVASGATSTERRALVDVAQEAGLQNAYLIQSGLASALGAGIPIIEPRGSMVINIGSSTTEVAVLSLGGIVSERNLKLGGDDISNSIVRAIKYNFGLNIGRSTAEEIKRLIGSVSLESDQLMTIAGQGVADTLPHNIQIHSDDIRNHLESSLEKIVLAARATLERTQPDLVADIAERGITLTGGGAYLNGLDDYLSSKLNVNCQVAQDPLLCNVKGAHIALTHLADYKRSVSDG